MKKLFVFFTLFLAAYAYGQFSYSSGTIATLAPANYWVYPVSSKSPSGIPYVMFRMVNYNNLTIKKWNGTGFTDITSFTNTDAGATAFSDYQGIAVDKDTNFHVVIRGTKNVSGTIRQGLFYGLYNGSTWSFEFFHNVDVANNSAYYVNKPIISVDNQKHPHIIYPVSGNGSAVMKYAVKNGTWSITDIVSISTNAGDELDLYDMVTEANGTVHVILSDEYNNDNRFDLKYYKFNGTSWSNENVLTGQYMGYNPQIAVNSAGKLFLFYIQRNSDGTSIQLKRANNVSGWQYEIMQTSDGTIDYNVYDVLINANGDFCYVYDQYPLDTWIPTSLHYVVNEGPSWTNYTTTSPTYPMMYETTFQMDNNRTVYSFHANDLDQRPHLLSYFIGNYSDPLPVELESFSAVPSNKTVSLFWKTNTEIKNHGFEIERKAANEENWSTLGFVNGNGSSNSPKEYSFIDNLPINGLSLYRLKQVDVDGSFKYYSPVEVSLITPDTYLLQQNNPNPFNPSTSIRFNLPIAGFVSLKVYDIMGSEVASLVNSYTEAGSHLVTWNGKDNNGSQMASGVYIYKLKAGSYTESKKMNLIK